MVIPIVIDTNLWSDLRVILTRLRERTGKPFDEIWVISDDDFLKRHLNSEEYESFRGVINAMNRLREIGFNSNNYEVHVPSFVYNEAGRSVSSKIALEATGNDKYLKIFKEVIDSLPVKTVVEPSVAQEGIDYPKKSKIKTDKVKKTIMKEFLQNHRGASLAKLIDHLHKADEGKKSAVKKKVERIKTRLADVHHKNQKWDIPMIEASKALGFSYETRTKALAPLFGSVNKYRDVNQIKFQEDPLEVLAERLTMTDEEFDFFDLQIYLYAKEKRAHILTKNTQAFQEINDPYFLGYFEDIKILHPLINFDNIHDMRNSGDLTEIIERSIRKDFKEVDVEVCRDLDRKLNRRVMEHQGRELALFTESHYNPERRRLEINTSLGSLLRVLRIENHELKVSRQFFFEEFNNKQVKILKDVDQRFFNNHLSSNDFVKDATPIEKTRNYFVKSKLLATYLEENKGVKEKIQNFHSSSRPYLDEFLAKYRSESGSDVRNLFLALAIESHFSESEVDEALHRTPSQVALPIHSCPPSRGGARKREAGECLLRWEQIDEFNEEKVDNRDPLKVKINSEKFLDHIKTIQDSQQRMQLIEFADQVLNSSEDHTNNIRGQRVPEVTHLINNHKVLNYFSKLDHISNALNYGMFAKNLLADLLNGKYKDAAMNVGFMAGGYGLSKVAAASLAKGKVLAEAGKIMLGNSLKFASPFIGRLLSPLVALDLYDQIKNLKAGDKDAIVAIVGDSITLIVDGIDVGISLLEIGGVIGEISAVTGPIGMAIGVIVLVGTDVFFAVKRVQKIDEVIHLTTGERWEYGAAAFFTFGLVKFNIERMAQVKGANNNLAKQALEAIKKSKDIQRIVIPSAIYKGDNDIRIADNKIFVTPGADVKWARVRPDDPAGGRIFCSPQGTWENPPGGLLAKCGNLIGVEDLDVKTKNYTLYNLGSGEDYVLGFRDTPNVFRIGKGKKKIRGGDKNDVFVLDEGTTFNDFPQGILDGNGGSNMFDFRGITNENNEAVAIMFQEDPVGAAILQITDLKGHHYKQQDLFVYDIDSVIGRENMVDFIYTNCSTKYVDTKGGRSDFPDHVYITHTKKDCNHDKLIQLSPNTMVINEAVTGKFSYFINEIKGDIKCVLRRSTPYKTLVLEENKIEHKFFINAKLTDIDKIDFRNEKNDFYDVDINIIFRESYSRKVKFELQTVLGYAKDNGGMDNLVIYLQDNVELRYHHNGMYALLKSDEPPMYLINTYQKLAIDLGISIFIFVEDGDYIVSIGSDQKDDVLFNDPSHMTYLAGNKGNNTYIITSGRDVLRGPESLYIPDVVIRNSDDDKKTQINTLDLHSISQQIKKDLGMELLMKHTIDSEKIVLYLFTRTLEGQIINVTSITFRNIDSLSYSWLLQKWCNNLHILLNNAPVVLRCDQEYKMTFGSAFDFQNDINNYHSTNYYTPIPLVFSGYEIVVIGSEDVEPYTEVIVKHKIGRYRYLRLDDDLVVTNGFEFQTPAYRPTSVMFKNFYKDPAIFFTLKLTFDDMVLPLESEKERAMSAEPMQELSNQYVTHSNEISGQHPRRQRRDLGISQDPSNGSETQQMQLSSPGVLGSVTQYLSNIYYKSLDYFQDYFKSLERPKPKLVLDSQQRTKVHFTNKYIIGNERISGPKDIPSFNENELTNTDVNSTLLLLDTLVRKLNDSKYKQPVEDYLLSPDKQMEKKMVELIAKLGLDPNDMEGSMEKQHQRILKNIGEE